MIVGRIEEVSLRTAGSVFDGDHIAGETLLSLGDVSHFDEDGGRVSINGVIYEYIAVDPDLDYITINPGLNTDAASGDLAALLPISQWKVATFKNLDDPGAPSDEATIHISLAPLIKEGIRDDVDQEACIVEEYNGELIITQVDGEQPSFDYNYLDPETIPLPDGSEPIVAPDSSPTIETTGSDGAITIVASGIVEPETILDYYMDGVLLESTRSSIYVVNATPSGGPLVDGTEYLFQVIARNGDLAAPPSPVVTGLTSPGVTTSIVQAIIQAGFVLAGEIQVGNILMTPGSGTLGEEGYDPGGIVIPLSSGGEIRFPADGQPATIDAILRTADLRVNGGMSINGLVNYINGTVTLGSGVLDPIQTMGIDNIDHRFTMRFKSTANSAYASRGLAKTADGTKWGFVLMYPRENWGTEFHIHDTSGNLLTKVSGESAELHFRGVTAIGNFFYVLGTRWVAGISDYQYRIHKYNATGGFVEGTWCKDASGGPLRERTQYWAGTIAADPVGDSVWVASPQNQNRMRFWRYTAGASSMTGDPIEGVFSDPSLQFDFSNGAMYVGNADFGGKRWVFSGGTAGSHEKMYVLNSAGVDQTSESWPFSRARGMWWDGTRFIATIVTTGGVDLGETNTNLTNQMVYAKYAWYDSNPANGHKFSLPSPAASYLISKRAFPRIYVPAPPNSGTGDDAANAVIAYIGTTEAGVKSLGHWTSTNTITYIVPVFVGSGSSPATVNTFSANSSQGELASSSVDNLGSLVKMKGDGTFRFGPIRSVVPGKIESVDPVHVVGTSGEPAYQNGFVDFVNNQGVTVGFFRYRKTPDGTSLKMSLDVGGPNTTTNNIVIFTLPSSHWPSSRVVGNPVILVNGSGAVGQINIETDGRVVFYTLGSTGQNRVTGGFVAALDM